MPAEPRVFRAAAADATAPLRWRHRLPRNGPVDRHAALIEAARERSVLHLGFVDEHLEEKLAEGVWLHARLAEVASSLVGLDSSAEGVAWARAHGYQAEVADVQSEESLAAANVAPVQVVIAGELIEHLDAPGPFLRALRPLVMEDGLLVLTTPNAYRLLNFVAPLIGAEVVHPDHTAWHSPQTLRTLLWQSGWQTQSIGYYYNPPRRAPSGLSPGLRAKLLLANGVRRGLAFANRPLPYWSDGLIVEARPRSS